MLPTQNNKFSSVVLSIVGSPWTKLRLNACSVVSLYWIFEI